MPKYYHIHRGTAPSELEKGFTKNRPLFFSKKNSRWYDIEQNISKDYGGYRMYEIYIPKTRFTTSFNPKTAGKIVKITKNNIKEYFQLRDNYKGNNSYIDELKIRNIIGVDATLEHKDKDKDKDKDNYGPPEGYVWQKPADIKIKLVEVVKL
jgi:hypothetical protein